MSQPQQKHRLKQLPQFESKVVEDFHKAANLYWQAGKLAEYKDTQARIIELEIEASLDILNF